MDQIVGFSVGTIVSTCVGGIVHNTLINILEKNEKPVFINLGFGMGFMTGGIGGIFSSVINRDLGILGGVVTGVVSGVITALIE